MKYFVLILFFFIISWTGFAKIPNSHFTASIEFTLNDSEVKKTIIKEFSLIQKNYGDNNNFETISDNNMLIFFVTSENDLTLPIKKTTEILVERLNGKVQTHGKSKLFKTSFSTTHPIATLEVITDDSHTSIVSLLAKSIPFRELLKEIGREINNFSYVISGLCADELTNINFHSQKKNSLDSLMRELARLNGLSLNKSNSTYIFSGSCKNNATNNKLYPIHDFTFTTFKEIGM